MSENESENENMKTSSDNSLQRSQGCNHQQKWLELADQTTLDTLEAKVPRWVDSQNILEGR